MGVPQLAMAAALVMKAQVRAQPSTFRPHTVRPERTMRNYEITKLHGSVTNGYTRKRRSFTGQQPPSCRPGGACRHLRDADVGHWQGVGRARSLMRMVKHRSGRQDKHARQVRRTHCDNALSQYS
eukprot:366245-Chlamydomonas_euryale.AAC.28